MNAILSLSQSWKMLQQIARLISFILVLGLVSQPQLLLATTPSELPQSDFSTSTVKQSTRLELSLSRRQVTLYQGTTPIKSYPVAVGRPGWETPTGNFQVRQMLRNPTWIHPWTDKAIPGGDPKNPLGRYWIGFWTDGNNWIGFHGTPNPETVGTAASHGCVRMYNKDIEELFNQVDMETVVTVIP
ncbi:MAG: L,D-transpeptidase [Kastovskya adunca ATA6-11-RM4]|jgi:lipoprotein-anchoring transpeptidase ErfK/SrfK|nr:L,D-transpeptidase [Kastovskya adunca ATA6-11-RM4]